MCTTKVLKVMSMLCKHIKDSCVNQLIDNSNIFTSSRPMNMSVLLNGL